MLSELSDEALDASIAAITVELRRRRDPTKYQTDPVAYIREILGITLWPEMEEASRAALVFPHRILCKSGHGVGKTMWCAAMISWFYDSFNPSLAITTAPTKRDVEDLLWKEVRVQRRRAELPDTFIGPSAPEMRTSDDHYAKGYTASKDISFQGRHDGKMMFVFDEAAGIPRGFWDTTKTMWKPELGHIWLAILNPTDTTTQAYMEDNARTCDGRPAWRTFSWSCLNHPNIVAQLKGDAPPVPSAVTLSQVEEWVTSWTTPVTFADRKVTDICWPPLKEGQKEEEGHWYRPGPSFESRCMGRWPSQGSYGVWSDSLWLASTVDDNGQPRVHEVTLGDVPQIGCDVGRYGEDDTAIVARWNDTVLSFQAVNGWKTTQTTGRLVELAGELAEMVNGMRQTENRPPIRAEEIPIKVDDCGVGGGVTDRLGELGFNVIGINAGSHSMWPNKYPNKRSELWFATAERARMGHLALGRLDRETLHRLKSEAMALEWEQDSAGRRCVESKDMTKKKLGRSPDGMDALNLAFSENLMWEAPIVLPPVERSRSVFDMAAWMERRQNRPGRRRLFGSRNW